MQTQIKIVILLMIAPYAFGALVPTYGTYFGGSGDINYGQVIATTSLGEIVIAGSTTSQSLPGTSFAFQRSLARGFPGHRDVFVAKFDPSGRHLLWSTFLGGDTDEEPVAITIDSAGSIYLVGSTNSSTFPTTGGAFRRTLVPNRVASFAVKISADGQTLLYSTYLPLFSALALKVNPRGEVLIGGSSVSQDYITPGAFSGGDSTRAIAVIRLNSLGSGLLFGANFGGGVFNTSTPTSVGTDAAGNVYIAGYTTAKNVPTTPDALQPMYSNVLQGPCCYNGFLLKADPSGTKLLYGTYFGPQYAATSITDMMVSADGSVYLAGDTNTTDVRATPGAALQTPAGGYILKFRPGSRSLDAFTYVDVKQELSRLHFGGTDTSGNVYLSYGIGRFGVLKLDTTSLSLKASAIGTGFGLSSSAIGQSGSVWLVGISCECEIGRLISSDAYQTKPPGAVIVQFSDILPSISAVGSSATFGGPFSAGQLITLLGSQMGPKDGSSAEIIEGTVTSANSNTRVLFDGVAAPILYTRTDQVNTAIPCSMLGHSATNVVVEYLGTQSPPVTLGLSPSAPAIFTADGSGRGQGAILNQDYSVNGPTNPAARGSAVMVYATGIGITAPTCSDGKIYADGFPAATLPVIGGIDNKGAQVLYSGQAPGIVSGVAQFNLVIPQDALAGNVPISVKIGDAYSQSGVTVAVK